jgi:histidinol phosphatase-like PHP family hydrolase
MSETVKKTNFSIIDSDWHVHSNFSDGKDELDILLRSAQFQGIKNLAITDHLYGEKFMNGKSIEEYLAEVDKTALKYPGMKVYKGIEGTLLDVDGKLSVRDGDMESFCPILIDFAWKVKGFSFDAPKGKTQLLKNFSKAFANLCKNKKVDIIAHPFNFGRLIDGFEFSWLSDAFLEEIAGYFIEGKKYFEIMNNIWWWFPGMPVDEFNANYLRIMDIFNSHGVKFSIGSDAHHHQGVGNLYYARMMLDNMAH